MKKAPLFLVAALASAALLAGGSPAGAALQDSPKSLKVKLVTFDGKQRLKVKRKVRLIASCSKDCNARVKLRLVTPVTTVRGGGSIGLEATGTWTIGVILSPSFRSYIRQNITRCRLVANFSAVDIETGKTVRKVKTFRFRR
jgi:hypothetical protein